MSAPGLRRLARALVPVVARVLPLALAGALAGCDELLVPDPRPDSPVEIFDQVWSDFDRYYAHFELSGVDWRAARARYRPLAAGARDDAALARAVAGMLAELRDPHVTLYTPGWTYQDTSAFRPGCFEPAVTARYVTSMRTAGGHISYGRIDARIGYLRIASFAGDGWADEIDQALAALPDASALVLDVRGNGGGDPAIAMAIAERFLRKTGIAEYVRYRSGPGHDQFGDFFPITVSPGGARRFDGRLALLTDRRDFSAAESFVLDLRAAAPVTVVGDTTGGASGRPLVRELPNGWTYRLSTWVAYTPDGRPYEGIGLAPDVAVRPRPGDWAAGTDRVLEAGIAALR